MGFFYEKAIYLCNSKTCLTKLTKKCCNNLYKSSNDMHFVCIPSLSHRHS